YWRADQNAEDCFFIEQLSLRFLLVYQPCRHQFHTMLRRKPMSIGILAAKAHPDELSMKPRSRTEAPTWSTH
ncbi:MAG: hypothetical protein AAFU69_11765, partial [Pseudomonadota bacterium]